MKMFLKITKHQLQAKALLLLKATNSRTSSSREGDASVLADDRPSAEDQMHEQPQNPILITPLSGTFVERAMRISLKY